MAFFNSVFKLTIEEIIGRSLVIHEKEDNCTDISSAGNRIAACVIGIMAGDITVPEPNTNANAMCVLQPINSNVSGLVFITQDSDTIIISENIVNYPSGAQELTLYDFGDYANYGNPNDSYSTPVNAYDTVSLIGSITDIIGRIFLLQNSLHPNLTFAQCVVGWSNQSSLPAIQATTGQFTTGQFTTGQFTTGQFTTGRATTGQFTTGQFTTGQFTTGTTGATGTNGTTGTTGTTLTNGTTTQEKDLSTTTSADGTQTPTDGYSKVGLILGIVLASIVLVGISIFMIRNRMQRRQQTQGFSRSYGEF